MTKTFMGYTPYQLKLLAFLSVATFFEGYDFIALVQVLPKLVEELNLQESNTGLIVGIVNVGAILSFLLIYLADKFGRKPIMMVTIAGYTITSFLTAFVGSEWAFACIQLLARIFLLGEVAISMIYAAEVFPAERRGRVIGTLQVAATLGTIFCAGLTPVLLQTELGWRSVYLVGAIPLILVAFARRNIEETERFKLSQSTQIRATLSQMFAVIKSPYRGRVLLMAVIWASTYLCAQSLITFWNLHAVQNLKMSYEDVSKIIMSAAMMSLPFLFLVGRILEFGRRKAATLTYGLLVFGAIGCYNFADPIWLTVCLTCSFFAISGVIPILNAYSVELFPTAIRANSYAWSNSLLGRLGYVFSPVIVGAVASVYGYSVAVTAMAIFPLLALVVILSTLRETAGLPLEQTCQLEGKQASDGEQNGNDVETGMAKESR